MPIENLSSWEKHPLIAGDEGLKKTLQLFSDILDCPRPSGEEQLVRTRLTEIAKIQGWEVKVDQRGNVAFQVEATEGKENVMPVVLQGHMDIVPTPIESRLEPRQAVIEDEGEKKMWMHTKDYQMTLGADNGMGLALAMAALMDKNLRHGPVTILCTVDEETGMSGAVELNPDLLPESGLLINLDNEDGVANICIGCAGSGDLVHTFPFGDLEKLNEPFELFELSLDKFPGGHSGVDIDKGHGNAIHSLANLLTFIQKEIVDFRLLDIKGGSTHNSIPKVASATIAIPQGFKNRLNDLCEAFQNQLREGEDNEKEMTFRLKKEKAQDVLVSNKLKGICQETPSLEFRNRIIGVLAGVPIGPFLAEELPIIGKLVTLSNNLSIVEIEEHNLKVTTMARAADIDNLRIKLDELRSFFVDRGGMPGQVEEPTAGWLEDQATSLAVAKAKEAVEAVVGLSKLGACHAGLEAGIIADKAVGKMSSVAIGPLVMDPHSEKERVEIYSVAETLAVVKKLLEGM